MNEFIQNVLNDPNAVIALCAVVISVISLSLSIATSFHNMKHNKLSVRPIAYVLPLDYEDKISVIIQNKGTGPLISKEIKFIDEVQNEYKYLIDAMPSLEDGYYWTTFSKTNQIILAPNEEKVLLQLNVDVHNSDYTAQRDKIRGFLSRIEVKMKYTSIFLERKPFEINKKLSWFRRST